MDGGALVTAIVAVALANQLLLAGTDSSDRALRELALHGTLVALVTTATTAVNSLLQPWLQSMAAPYPTDFMALPLAAAATALAAITLPRWRAGLRESRWPLIAADATALSQIAGTSADTATAALLRGATIGAAFALALAALAALRWRLQPARVPHAFRGTPIALLNAAFLALAGHALLGVFGA